MRHSVIALLGCISLASAAAGEEVRSLRRPGAIPGAADPVFVEQAELAAWDGGYGNHFGWVIAISGDTLIAGAAVDSPPAGTRAGAAYVFVRNGTGWTQQQKLTASDGAPGDFFGFSVAVAGDTAVIGAIASHTPDGRYPGAAYVFTRTGTVWTEQQKLVASDGMLGRPVRLVPGTLGGHVGGGGRHADTPRGVDAGAAYVFVRTGAAWTEQQKLTASDGAGGHRFGTFRGTVR